MGMTCKLPQRIDTESPFEELVYRALVFKRSDHNEIALYFVAGVLGGPWKAEKALAHSHKLHGGPCFYCGMEVPTGEATVDHIEPLSAGGRGTLQNLAIACKPCNSLKGHQPIDAFNPGAGRVWLEALLNQIQQRLNNLNPASSPPRPLPDAAGAP